MRRLSGVRGLGVALACVALGLDCRTPSSSDDDGGANVGSLGADGGRTDDGATDGGHADSGVSATSDGGPSAFLAACRGYFADECALATSRGNPLPGCPDQALVCERWAVEVDRGFRRYDAQALARCREGLVWSTQVLAAGSVNRPPDLIASDALGHCAGWLLPNVGLGDACLTTLDCRDPSAICTSPQGTCPMRCQWEDVPPEPGRCDPACRLGAYCEQDGGCRAGGGAGEACISGTQFPSGVPECDRALGLDCEPTTGRCVDVNSVVSSGAACGVLARCPDGEACVGLRLDHHEWRPGVCATPALGDECGSFSTCPPASRCASADGGWVGTGVGTCVPVSLGSSCSSDDHCLNEHRCAGSPGACAARIAPGGACSTEAECALGTKCVETMAGDWRCVAPGGADQPCAEAKVVSARCAAGLLCLAGTCRETGRLGGPCARVADFYLGCAMSRCAWDAGVFDAGLGIPIGRCVELSPLGAPCATDGDGEARECASGICRGGSCSEPCP